MFEQLRLAAISHAKADAGECPACGYFGRFGPFGMPVRTGSMCPKCWSLERQRLLSLALLRNQIEVAGRDVIHFAGESGIAMVIKAKGPKSYQMSEFDGRGDVQLDIERIALPDEALDLVIANHILEHVNDRVALKELYRVLKPGGELVCMVPIVEGWAQTYENSDVTTPFERERHFGQFDHVRYYGADLRNRIVDAGFSLREITADPADVLRYRLLRGEKVFVGSK